MMQATTATKSGPGTSMLSRTGASTINHNKCFQGNHDNIDDYISEIRNARKFHATSLAGHIEEEEPPHIKDLPKINEGRGG